MDLDFYEFQNILSNAKQETGVFARFYDKAIRTGELNKKGLPEVKVVTYVEIRVKDQHDVFDQPAKEDHFKRFPVEYSRYQMEKKQIAEGTPLADFAFLSVEQFEACKFRGIFTVEALSSLDDEKAKDLGLANEKELAQRFLDVSKNNKVIDDFAKKEREYKAKIKKLEEEIKILKAEQNS